jgi:hypothetical protein
MMSLGGYCRASQLRQPTLPTVMSLRSLVLALTLASIASPLAAGDGAAVVQAERLEPGEEIRIDGRVDEAVWQRIAPLSGFLQRDPVEGGEPSERTEIRIAYDRDNLYIGAIFHDSDPDGIIAHQRARNAGLGTDDRFMWVIDPFGEGRGGYFFEINPAGLMGDGLISAGGGVNKSWDGIWEVRTARIPEGWSAEIRIPFRTLNFDPQRTAWGINFQRTIRRKQEEILWTGHRRNQSLTRTTHAGRLVGLHDISQGIGLEAKPFLTAGLQQPEPGASLSGSSPDVGLDLTYSVTPSLRAAVTINTDFAEVETDQRRVNLTRFPLSFPERRDFFLEGSSVFSFSPVNGITPFFSRRIGLVGGDPIPIVYGGRLAGQAGPYDLGFFQVRTGATDIVPSEDFTAARAVRGLFSQSSLGAIYTRRGTHADGELGSWDAHTVGMDLDLYTSTFRGDRNLQFEALFASHTPLRGDDTTGVWDRTARGVRLTYPNDPLRWHVSYREFGMAFDPPVGFAPRRAFRRLQPSLGYTFRPAWSAVRTAGVQIAHTHLMDLDFRPQSVSTAVTPVDLRFESGESVGMEISREFERLDRPFRIHPDVEIPTGDYSTWRAGIGASTASRRAIAAGAELSSGGFWSGERTTAGTFLTVRPLPGVNLTGNLEWNDVRLAEGQFSTTLTRISAGVHPSPLTALTSTIQYDDLSRIVGLYSRLRWTVRPGSDVFLVYTHNWLDALDGPLETRERGAVTKLTYTHRF